MLMTLQKPEDRTVIAIFEYLDDGTVRQTYPTLTTDLRAMRVKPLVRELPTEEKT